MLGCLGPHRTPCQLGYPSGLRKWAPGTTQKPSWSLLSRWPPQHWDTLIAPYLTGPAQAACQGLDLSEALEYTKVKATVLEYLDINPEMFCQRFLKERYPLGGWPHVVAQHLKEQCCSWLNQKKQTRVQVAEAVVLEQFTQILPAGGKEG